MLRSVAGRSGLAATRFMATDAAPAGAPNAHQPAPTPPSGSGFMRRVMPLAILGGTGYVLYKGGTDPNFRASVENLVPASARLFDLLPAPSPSPKFVAQTNKKEAAAQMGSNQKNGSTLPSSYSSVPDILLKIEESNPQVANAEGSPEAKNRDSQTSHLSEDRIAVDNMTPTQRAAARAKGSSILMHEAGDGPRRPPKSVKPVSSVKAIDLKEQQAEKEREKLPIVAVDDVASVPASTPAPESVLAPASASGPAPAPASGPTSVPANQKDTSVPKTFAAKGKLARILGKGDFQAENVQGPDVVDDSEYQKPNFPAKKPMKTPPKKASEWRLLTSPQQSKVETPAIGSVRNSATLEEVKALRAELQSQTKWEAVRLQEAVRSQMVEDKKIAAKEIAAISKKHAEELALVREDALNKANKLISERTRELKESADKQRDVEVGKLLKAKEEELRDSLALEFASKQHQQVVKREQVISDIKAQVAAMTSQFGAFLVHSERARDAAKRASHAFLLQEIIRSSRPLGSQLSKASDGSELGRLVKESVPESAVQKGVSSLDALQIDFNRAAKEGLSAAMIPDDKAGTIWGHLLGAVFSRLKIPVDARLEPDSIPKCNEDRIRLAEHLVKEGDLGGAISTLESLEGLSADVMADWIGAARARIAADLAANVLLADAIIAQVSFTRGGDTEPVVA